MTQRSGPLASTWVTVTPHVQAENLPLHVSIWKRLWCRQGLAIWHEHLHHRILMSHWGLTSLLFQSWESSGHRNWPFLHISVITRIFRRTRGYRTDSVMRSVQVLQKRWPQGVCSGSLSSSEHTGHSRSSFTWRRHNASNPPSELSASMSA